MRKPAVILACITLLAAFGAALWFGDLAEYPRVALSPQERDWLDQHPELLTLLYNIDFPPIEYASPEGDFTGLGADVIAAVEQRLGVRFLKRPSADWNQHLAALENGQCAIAPTIVRTAERERFAVFTAPYATAPVVIITTRALPGDLTLDDLAGRRVAVVSGYATEKYVRDRAQGRFEVIPMQTVREGLRHVAFGQVDALVENLAVAAYYIQQEGLPNLRVAGSTDFAFAWRIGISGRYPLLASAVQKALADIPDQELETLRRRWIAIDVNSRLHPETVRLLQLAALFIVLLVLGLSGIAGLLKRQLREKVASLQQTHEELRASEEQYRTLVNNLNIGVYRNTTGRQGRFLQANPAVIQMFGYASEADFLQVRVTDLYAYSAERYGFVREILEQGQVANRMLHLRRRNGELFWGAITARVACDERGRIKWLDGVIEDITERQEAEARRRLAAAVFEAAREAILVTDAAWKIVAVNPAFTTFTGYTEREVLGKTPRWLWAERQPRAYFEALGRTVAHDDVWQGEGWVRRKNRERRAVLISLATVRDAARQITHYVGVATDITALKEAEQRIERLAFFDALTGLPNRVLLAQRAELALALAWRRKLTLAVLFLDLDRFKEVNDSLGHAEGDALLVQVANRLRTLIRDEDTICRLGGDEFVLLLLEVDQQGALQVAERILETFRQPFTIIGHSLQITVSIGIALYPHDGVTFDDLLKNADAALYRAKQDGRNDRVFYDRAMNAATFERLLLEAELRQALAEGQLRAYFQPKVRLADGALVGAEALVRWQRPGRGLVPPGQFIPVAEASNLIIEIGDWMLAAVCRQLAEWRRQGLPALTVAVNLAARHFRQPGLADRVRGLLEAHELPPSSLELELTESTLLEADKQVASTLQHLEQLGVHLALDDFGTGYSSLSYLKRLPLTTLKIDRSFVRDLVTDPDDRMRAATIVALGHQMKLTVVAEGVETDDQRQLLLDQGCDLAQGYLFDQPIPAEAFAGMWLDSPPRETP